jgi:hypothetical protein
VQRPARQEPSNEALQLRARLASGCAPSAPGTIRRGGLKTEAALYDPYSLYCLEGKFSEVASAFAETGDGADVREVDCSQSTPDGNASLEGQQVLTPSGEQHLVCHGDTRRGYDPNQQGAETFEADCPTPSGVTNPDFGSGLVAPSGQTTVTCHNADVGGL